MPCPDYEARLFQLADGELPAADQSATRSHLAGCAECRAFFDGLRILDSALARSLSPVRLPADFEKRLRNRLARAVEPLDLERQAARKHQLDAEYHAALRQMTGWSRWIPQVLDVLGYGATAAAAAWLAWKAEPQLSGLLPARLADIQTLVLPTMLAAVFLAFGLGAAFRRRTFGLPG
jgi:anti-sigma factor RsiW